MSPRSLFGQTSGGEAQAGDLIHNAFVLGDDGDDDGKDGDDDDDGKDDDDDDEGQEDDDIVLTEGQRACLSSG